MIAQKFLAMLAAGESPCRYFFGGGGGGQQKPEKVKIPDPPKIHIPPAPKIDPVPAPPTESALEVQDKMRQEKRDAKSRKGVRSTLLAGNTGPGYSSAATGPGSLLG